ncbi:MAG TPA: MBOAT family O-acyltransferase [Planctomycetaceae bacterium]|jgi:D-alanyl-lipoteichoic acid acyltransferase DltB (MBOAT superfamily)|nr:MBOAT family O-acyltransferase [Planctomycetaceae bacterium]
MAVCSLAFLFFCGAVVIVYHLAPGKLPRQLILASASAIFLYPLVPNLRSWIWFAVMLVASYLALFLVRARPRGANVVLGIGVGLAIYMYLKRYDLVADFIPFPHEWDVRLHPVEVVGLSYMIFKFIHVLVDQWQGQLARIGLWQYLNYQLSFFTIVAGPIQRYNDFARYWDEMDLRPSETRESLLLWIRILTGMIKVGLLGAFVQSSMSSSFANLTPGQAWLAFYAYPVYLYFNFSGYTDIVIGAAGLLGFRLPENFNRPWLSRNVLDFWDRWHITLTHWIRDYVFMASYKSAAMNFPTAARYWSYALLFVALFLAGVWHGTTDGFVIFGVLNGVGAAATRAYGDVLRATLGRSRLHAYMKSRTVRLIAIVVTLHYVCLCQLFFSSNVDRALLVLRTIGSGLVSLPSTFSVYSWRGPVVVTFVVAALLIALWRSDAAGSFIERLALRIGARNGRLSTILCVLCVFVAGMFFVDWAFTQEPPPVLYMQF